jgi:maltose alpha-D-glucosyltransferase/alpha-amylase
MLAEHPRAGIVRVRRLGELRTDVLCEAVHDESLWRLLLGLVRDRQRLRGMHGTLMGLRLDAASRGGYSDDSEIEVSLHRREQRNTSAFFDEQYVLKLFRRISPGINPEFEVGSQLTQRSEFVHVPNLVGALDYRGDSGRMASIAVLHEFVSTVSDGWSFSLDELARYFERVQTRTLESGVLTFPEGDDDEPPQLAQETIGAYLHWAELMGTRVGELHVALATTEGGIAFSPEPFTRLYQRSLYQSMRSNARATLDQLRSRLYVLEDETRARAEELLDRQHDLLTVFSKLLHEVIDAQRIRCHGDLHLGQLLFTGKDFVIIDFEGDPWRPVSERRIKASPLSDMARMLRSFREVAQTVLGEQPAAHQSPQRALEAEQWASYWQQWVSAVFVKAYLAGSKRGEFFPTDAAQLQTLIAAYLLDAALDAVQDELRRNAESVGPRIEAVLELLH